MILEFDKNRKKKKPNIAAEADKLRTKDISEYTRRHPNQVRNFPGTPARYEKRLGRGIQASSGENRSGKL